MPAESQETRSQVAAVTPAPAVTPATKPPASKTPSPVQPKKPAEAPKTSTPSASKPEAAPAAVAATSPPPYDSGANALDGMPLPNLPALRRPDQQDSAAAPTQVARADTPVPAASGDQTAELARAELAKAQNRIGLSDAQLAKLQAAQDRMTGGDNGGAFVMLQTLNAELQSETRSYVVRDNESMWHVAGQPEVYGNSYLWPLVWQANRDKVKKPGQLYKGLRLVIPAHPTAEEVSQALAYSKTNNLEGMNQADSQ